MPELNSTAEYQRLTAYHRAGMSGRGMDPSNKPDPYKKYPEAIRVELSRDLTLPKAPAHGVLSGRFSRSARALDLAGLTNLLFMANGFTGQVDYGNELFLYRSAPSAGALYPTEMYIAARGIEGLEDGLYHYSIIDFSLHRLRSGPPPEGVPAPAVIFSGLFFRSAWKYGDRAFRYCLMDAGHLAENTLLSAAALGLTAGFSMEFDDDRINGYLGLDPARETALATVVFENGADNGAPADYSGPVPVAGPVAPNELVFDRIVQAARLTTPPISPGEPPTSDWRASGEISLADPAWDQVEGPSFVQAIQNRRSARNFVPKNPTAADLARTAGMVLPPDFGRTVTVGLVINEVQDYRDGYYRLAPDAASLAPHLRGFIAPSLARAALDQDWSGRANTILVISAPLAALEKALGPRSLRSAYLTAGRIGQRAYLAAQVMNWGCCGLGAFFDDETARVLDLPAGEVPLYLVPMGPIKRRTHGGRPE